MSLPSPVFLPVAARPLPLITLALLLQRPPVPPNDKVQRETASILTLSGLWAACDIMTFLANVAFLLISALKHPLHSPPTSLTI